MEPENPYEPPQHSGPTPGEEMSSVEFGRRRRLWTWLSLAPGLIPLLGVIMALRTDSDWLVYSIANVWIVPPWLILCACMIPAPRHLQGTWQAVLWKIGWYVLFIIVHLVLIYLSMYAGCSMRPSRGSWH